MAADESSGFVRQFALTQGRVRSAGGDLPLDTLVEATEAGRLAVGSLAPERRRIVEYAQATLSIAEISAHLHVHLGIARVLVGDLVADGYVVVGVGSTSAEAGPDLQTLERLLDDLHSA